MVEIRRILCPVDLSEFSRHALDHARAIAQWYEANISVLHVISPVELIAPVVGVAGAVYLPSRALDAREIANEVRQFSGLKDLSQESQLKVVVAEGSPAKEIVRHAEALPADLLVMGTHGRSGFERLFLGSVTDKVLRSTQVPVLTVPPPVDRVGSVVYKTILCPIEFSGPSARALEFALIWRKKPTRTSSCCTSSTPSLRKPVSAKSVTSACLSIIGTLKRMHAGA